MTTINCSCCGEKMEEESSAGTCQDCNQPNLCVECWTDHDCMAEVEDRERY